MKGDRQVHTATSRGESRRERLRAATIEEIKAAALDHMHRLRTCDITISDVARSLGMTAPAIYRYFAGREGLLESLVVDAFDELGRRLGEAAARVPAADPGLSLLALSDAFRTWSRAEPVRFALMYGLPVPGYCGPESEADAAASRAMQNFGFVVESAREQGSLREPRAGEPPAALLDAMREKGWDLGGPACAAMLHGWAALHGVVCLETFGHFDWLPEPARDAVFLGVARMAAEEIGVPAPALGWTPEGLAAARGGEPA